MFRVDQFESQSVSDKRCTGNVICIKILERARKPKDPHRKHGPSGRQKRAANSGARFSPFCKCQTSSHVNMLPLLSLKIFASWCILKQAVWRRFTFQSWLPNIKTKFARLEMRGFSADRRRGRKSFKIWFPLRAKQKAPAKTSKWAVSWPSCGEVFISGTFDLPEFSLGKQTEQGRRARSFYYTVARGCSGNWAQDLSHSERESC